MKKAPSPFVSLIPIIVLILLLFGTIHTFGSDALSGGSQVSLLTTTAICVLIGMAFYKIPWKDYEIAITNNVAGCASLNSPLRTSSGCPSLYFPSESVQYL